MPTMFIRVETSSGVPITRQIGDQIRAQCASGALRPGDRLASVRELARQLAVNQNTVLRVYERLTQEGVLEMRRGDGTYVADVLPRGTMRRPQQQLEEEVERLVRHAQMLGVESKDVRELVDEIFAKLKNNGRTGRD